MTEITIAGIDPALNNTGLVKANLDVTTNEMEIIGMRLVETKPGKEKTVRKNSDDLERARTIKYAMDDFLKDCSLAFVEMPVGTQSARGMCSYGICVGLVASIAIPVIQVTPLEVKFAVKGSKQASKADIIKWAVDKYPSELWITKPVSNGLAYLNKNEHLIGAEPRLTHL